MTSIELAREIRVRSLRMVASASASHIGSCLSCADLLAVLYSDVLRVSPKRPGCPSRDRFVMSKGHAAAALYACLATLGFFPTKWLDEYGADGSPLAGHAHHRGVPGVEISTGSLGHGLSIAAGMALALRRRARAIALLSDGELDEGAVWEAALFAAHHRLEGLVAVIDANGIQSFGRVDDVMRLEPIAEKWRAFGWETREIDGHDHDAIREALVPSRRPLCVVARTVKGKGVSFMENQLAWHYQSPHGEYLKRALAELNR